MEYPPTIFGPVPEEILQLWNTVSTTNVFYGGYASNFTLKAQNDEKKVKLTQMKQAVQFAQKVLNKMCQSCNGNHNIWCIAGGAAANWNDSTNNHSDYDFYVCCEGMFNLKLVKKIISKTSIIINITSNHKTQKICVMDLVTPLFTIQVIPVKFPFLHVQNVPAFQDFFATFDLPICRVAIKFPLTGDAEDTCARIVDLSFIQTHRPVSVERQEKYIARSTNKIIQPGKLSNSVLFSMISSTLLKLPNFL